MSPMAKKAVICIFDGLRPDRISQENTPNLWRFVHDGVWYRECRSIFPSMTRVAGCSFATGSLPGVHGIVDNMFYLPPLFKDEPLDTGQFGDLMSAEKGLDGSLVEAEGLGCALARAGKSYAVTHTGSAGSSYMVNHKADLNGHWTFNLHGREKTKTPQAVDEMVDRFGPLPQKGVPQYDEVDYGARVFCEYVLPERRPDVALIWFVEPDTSYHFTGGVGSHDAEAVTHRVDQHFGRILEVIADQPDGAQTLVAAMSDHGHLSTIDNGFELLQALGEAGFAAARRPGPGVELVASWGVSSAMRLVDSAKGRLAELARTLMGFEQTGMVLSSPSATPDGPLPGTISYDLVGLDHPRSPDLIWVARTFDDGLSQDGIPGTGMVSGQGLLAGGSGMHGGMSRAELNSLLAFGGAGLPALGPISDPAHITDIAPTLLAALGCGTSPGMSGHPLAGVMGLERPRQKLETITARLGEFAQSLTLDMGGPHPIVLTGGRDQ